MQGGPWSIVGDVDIRAHSFVPEVTKVRGEEFDLIFLNESVYYFDDRKK